LAGGSAGVVNGAVVGREPGELDAIGRAGEVVNAALRAAGDACLAGATTAGVNDAAASVISDRGGAALFRGYRQGGAPPFPGDVCVSVNEEVVHGVPSGARRLRSGDLVSVDVGVLLDGWCADSATSFVVEGGGVGGEEAALLVESTRRVLGRARELMEPGVRWSAVARELEAMSVSAGYGFVTEYVGHGIGRALHEPPKAPSYWSGYVGRDFELVEGSVLAVEPLLASGRRDSGGRVGVEVAADGWTVRLREGVLACHEECVIAAAAGGGRVLSGIALERP